jgi:hypothetical protein
MIAYRISSAWSPAHYAWFLSVWITNAKPDSVGRNVRGKDQLTPMVSIQEHVSFVKKPGLLKALNMLPSHCQV